MKIHPQEAASKRCILATEHVRAMKTNKPSAQMTQIQQNIVPGECTRCVTGYQYIKQCVHNAHSSGIHISNDSSWEF